MQLLLLQQHPFLTLLLFSNQFNLLMAILLIIFVSTKKIPYDFLKTSSTDIFFPFSNATIKAEEYPLDFAS